MTLLTLLCALAADPAAFAGTGQKGYAGDNGPAAQARLNQPFDVAFDATGNLYFSDTGNHRVRRVDAKTGVITTVAGNGEKGFSGDGGPATAAKLNEPYGVKLRGGSLYIVDRLNNRVRRVDLKSGVITTVAGNGRRGHSGDGGPATAAKMVEPNGVALDGRGRLVIADVRGQRLRVVDLKTGVIDTLCGTGRRRDSGAGPYRKASLKGPRAVAFGPDGSLYVVQREGHSVRRIDFKTGRIVPFAGTGKKGYAGDGGPALRATFNGPKEVAVDRAGNVFVVDTENQAIRRIDAETGIVTTAAKGLARPHGVAVGPGGALYVGDTDHHVVARVPPR